MFLFGFTQGEGGEGRTTSSGSTKTSLHFSGEFNGETKSMITKGGKFINIRGTISGTISGTIDNETIDNEKHETETIDGTIKKGTIEGNIEQDLITHNLVIRGKIIGIFKGIIHDKTVERLIEGDDGEFAFNNIFGENKNKGPSGNSTNEFVAIKIATSLNGTIKNVLLKDDCHYNMFKMCKLYIEDASESEYQLWPVIKDPSVS